MRQATTFEIRRSLRLLQDNIPRIKKKRKNTKPATLRSRPDEAKADDSGRVLKHAAQ